MRWMWRCYRAFMAGTGATDPTSVAAAFNDNINRRDLEGLAALMTDDHRFIDTAGEVVSGKRDCLDAWRGCFESFPDYRNVFTSLAARGDLVTIVGHSVCAEPALAGPALWRATTRDGMVAEWRVYPDTPDMRAMLHEPAA
jgi:ketosteroid isomerase-like protein